jgi:hypothetical protein
MPGTLRPWAFVMLSAGALFAGGLVWYAWERVWIWRRLDLPAFAIDFRRSVRRADPAMPILLVICGAAASAGPEIPEHRRRLRPVPDVGPAPWLEGDHRPRSRGVERLSTMRDVASDVAVGRVDSPSRSVGRRSAGSPNRVRA